MPLPTVQYGSQITKSGNQYTRNTTSNFDIDGWVWAWDGGLTAGGSFDFTVNSAPATGEFFLGMSTAAANGFNAINYALNFFTNGIIYLYESGSMVGSFGTWAQGDTFVFKYTGSNIELYKNGSGTAMATSAATNGQTLYLDCIMYGNGTSFTISNFGTAVPPDTTAPTWTSSASVSINSGANLGHDLVVTDDSGYNSTNITFSVVGGTDSGQFSVASWNQLIFSGAGSRSYASPQDSNADNVYQVIVRAMDAAGNSTDQTITVTVVRTRLSARNCFWL